MAVELDSVNLKYYRESEARRVEPVPIVWNIPADWKGFRYQEPGEGPCDSNLWTDCLADGGIVTVKPVVETVDLKSFCFNAAPEIDATICSQQLVPESGSISDGSQFVRNFRRFGGEVMIRIDNPDGTVDEIPVAEEKFQRSLVAAIRNINSQQEKELRPNRADNSQERSPRWVWVVSGFLVAAGGIVAGLLWLGQRRPGSHGDENL